MTEIAAATRYFTLATAGHVDHGKTSLLRALTGIDPDRLKEEKERGMTTDLGFAHLFLPGQLAVGFIDVPGHGKFLKNMLAGVGGIEIALLVVAADEGPMPQTLEHVRILALLGIKGVLVALTKIDLVDDELVDIVEQQVKELLGTEGIELLGMVPVSAVKGGGIEELKKVLAESLNKIVARERAGGAFLPVDRVFSKAGFGTIVTGTLVRGQLAVGDQVNVEPGGLKARIRRLETFGRSLERASAGQRLAVNLVVRDDAHLARGHVVLAESTEPTSLLLVHLAGFPKHMPDDGLAKLQGQPLRFYHGTAECHGRLRWIEPVAVSKRVSKSGSPEAIAAFSLSQPVVAEAGDRFVIRLSDDTIYGGAILLRDQPRWLTRAKTGELANLLLHGEFAEAAVAYVKTSAQKLVPGSHLDRILPSDRRIQIIEQLVGQGKLARPGDFLTTREFWLELRLRAVKAVEAYGQSREKEHAQPGMPLEHLRSNLMPAADRSAFQALVSELVDEHLLVRQIDKLTVPGKAAPAANPKLEALCGKVEKILQDNVCLEIEEIAKLSGASAREVKAAIESMAGQGKAALVDYEYASSASTLASAHQLLGRLWQEKRQITPSEFKEGMNTTRKYAMAMLAYFDDRKITRRMAEGRALLVSPPG